MMHASIVACPAVPSFTLTAPLILRGRGDAR